jgi:Flp pilus assembly protein TadG
MLKRARSYLRDRKGLAAVEFALIAPVMVIMFFGAVELSSALDCNSRVARVSSTVADLVAQSAAVSTADTTNIFSAANAILYPYASSNAKIVVTSLVADSNGTVTVGWSDAQNTSKRTSPPTSIPTGILPASTSVIYAEVTYSFTPAVSYLLGTVSLTGNFYSKPRRSVKVTHS